MQDFCQSKLLYDLKTQLKNRDIRMKLGSYIQCTMFYVKTEHHTLFCWLIGLLIDICIFTKMIRVLYKKKISTIKIQFSRK